MRSALDQVLLQPPPPSRVSAVERLRLRGRYLWRHSGNPYLRQLRLQRDRRGAAFMPVIHSELGGTSITYAGLTDGIACALEFTEQQRDPGAGHAPVRSSQTMRTRDIERVRSLPAGDIVIIGTTAAKGRQLPAESSFVMPMRVHFVIDFNADIDTVLARTARGERRNFRQKCRQHDWQLTIERDPEQFDHFYDRIYRATMYRRHGARQRIEGKESAYECLFCSGILFMLHMDGRRVGGHLCHWNWRSRVLTSRLLGVLDGEEEYYAAGALKVMHFLLIRWAGEHGVRQLDLQGTEPFLSKGTYQLKRLFGARVVLPPNHFGDKRLWLQVRRDTPEVRDFLVANPFLTVRDDGTFDAVYFYDQRRAARTDYKANSPGVSFIRHVHLDDFFTASHNRIENSLRSNEALIPDKARVFGRRGNELPGDVAAFQSPLRRGLPVRRLSAHRARSFRRKPDPRRAVTASRLPTPSPGLASEAGTKMDSNA
jgi:hypothetical protein